MRIAFVNQPFDVILPPMQNSIGYYTYGIGRSLARTSDVIVYGSRDTHAENASELCDPSLHFRFVASAKKDLLLFEARKKLGNLIPISAPISTSGMLFPEYGRQVAEDLQHQQCDIIHIQHCSQYAAVVRSLNPKAKIVLQIHAECFSQSDFKTLQRRLENVDLLLTVSDHITRKTIRDFPGVAGRCETMYCGIDPDEFRAEKDYGAFRGRKEKRILFSGAVSPHKGAHVLLDAFSIVAREYPNVRLEFVGTLRNYPREETFDLKDRKAIWQLAPFYAKRPVTRLSAKLGFKPADAGTYQGFLKSRLTPEIAEKVTFTGFIERQDFVARYYEADVFVFPPIWDEGFGIPPIEAMAAGLPVVGSLSGALPETVIPGENGFLVEKGDVRALAQQILRLLKDDDLRETMGRAGRGRVLANFTWERVAGALENRYRRLLTEPCGFADEQLTASAAN